MSPSNRADSAQSLDVTLITPTPADGMDESAFPYRVVRCPPLLELIRLVRWADVVHIAGPALLPMVLCWILRKAAVVEHHGYQANCPNGLLFHEAKRSPCPGHFMASEYGECLTCNAANQGWAKSLRMLALTFVRRYLLRQVQANIAITEHVARRVALPRSEVIYYGIADASETCATVETTPDPSGGKRPASFAFVGLLVSVKGAHLLIDALSQLRKAGYAVEGVIIGEGPEREALKQRAGSSGIADCLRFTGPLRGEELQKAIVGTLAVVVPSTWEEPAGLVAIEPQALGRTVIAANTGGLPEMVGDAGVLFPAGDVSALVNAMKNFLDDPELAMRLGESARKRTRSRFTGERMAREHAQLYWKVGRRQWKKN